MLPFEPEAAAAAAAEAAEELDELEPEPPALDALDPAEPEAAADPPAAAEAAADEELELEELEARTAGLISSTAASVAKEIINTFIFILSINFPHLLLKPIRLLVQEGM
ncbi:hypothetical protein A3A71_02025 [Candidatus Berkelbacteria bacterium RIFCSPLOWO2_01_FULL_50_28]|uniref:Uncharacterized protein n=1 Tax=Candidatus Berkelbacteria bacterium RIFCSPLOWO2_01_FULL_50_28 TaxID=1797471 RepID=A0A1F5EBS8_9BACT|nr:MAG: hypothetical protein A2807_00420 [Candidatus Berkelbacteria bacterium RIFCSPHIGHO2_01_FULL_50_36]OGD64801.1 MAG: hypothetical protein A3A71_02025 [Candidatus Berkelbacteria bacterium RIFCSPLOWO2_01_FULL_50_28]